MNKSLLGLIAAPFVFSASLAFAEPEYVRIDMSTDVKKSAQATWKIVGDYCDISKWLGLPCEITSGDGGVGTVRSLLGGRIVEVMVAKTELAYGYAMPAPADGFYDQYHGFLEARPVSADSSKLIYTVMLDVSNLADQAAKDAEIANRRGAFEGALANMKAMAEK